MSPADPRSCVPPSTRNFSRYALLGLRPRSFLVEGATHDRGPLVTSHTVAPHFGVGLIGRDTTARNARIPPNKFGEEKAHASRLS